MFDSLESWLDSISRNLQLPIDESNKCNPNCCESFSQTLTPRTLLPSESNGGENTPMPILREDEFPKVRLAHSDTKLCVMGASFARYQSTDLESASLKVGRMIM